MEKTKLGGEFAINPKVLSGFAGEEYDDHYDFFSSGRSALMALLIRAHIGNKSVIHIPFYICDSVVIACKSSGFEVKFYEPEDNFVFPITHLNTVKRNEFLLTVNYFGFIKDNEIIKNIKRERPDITVISDQVQSFWTYDQTEADFSFTSLRKHFPIPDGALIHNKNKNFYDAKCFPEASFFKNKLLGSFLKFSALPDEVYLRFLEEGEHELNRENSPSRASALSHYLYQNLSLEEIGNRRKENYRFIYEYGSELGLDFVFPFDHDVIPLNVPVLVKNRNKVREGLKKYNIFLPVHWPVEDYNKNSRKAKIMAASSLSLIVDQRYSCREMEYQLDCLVSQK